MFPAVQTQFFWSQLCVGVLVVWSVSTVWLHWGRVRFLGWVHVHMSTRVCICFIRLNERTKFHMSQKEIMAHHRIKDCRLLKMASCPTNFIKKKEKKKTTLLAHQASTSTQRQHGCSSEGSEALCSFQRAFSAPSLLFSHPANNEQTEIKLNIWPTF